MSITPCTPQPIVPGIVVFVPADFRAAYPSFAGLPDATLQGNFALATLLLDNSCCSVVQDANVRSQLLNLATAHLSALLNGANGEPPSGAVGRLAQATEGSVSAQLEWASSVSNSEAFFIQTQWGAMFWQMTLRFRTARYVAPRRYGGSWPC